MIAKYNGHCKYENETKCGGIRSGERIVHKGRGNTYHPDCASRTPEENDRSNFEGAFLNQGYANWAFEETSYGGVVDRGQDNIDSIRW